MLKILHKNQDSKKTRLDTIQCNDTWKNNQRNPKKPYSTSRIPKDAKKPKGMLGTLRNS